MTYAFDYYMGKHLVAPVKPKKPYLNISVNPFPNELRKYADDLEKYNNDLQEYKILYEDGYLKPKENLLNAFKKEIKKDYNLGDEVFNHLWETATYNSEYPENLKEVFQNFEDLYEFSEKYCLLKGKL